MGDDVLPKQHIKWLVRGPDVPQNKIENKITRGYGGDHVGKADMEVPHYIFLSVNLV